VQDAVDAESHDERVLLGLEVDVGRAVLGGLEQDGVDEADERYVGDAVVGLEVGVLVDGDIDVVLVLGQRDAGAERLRVADELADGGEDVLARRCLRGARTAWR